MAKLKFVLIGCGRIATLHVAGYKDNPDGQLWGVCDIDAKAAKKFAEEHCVPKVYKTYEEVLADPEVAAVELLIPHHLHCEYTVKACEAKKHVSVQKPMAMNLAECDTMIKAAKDNGVLLKVFENFRFYPPYRLAKKMIDDGEIGNPQGIRLKMNNAGLKSNNVPFIEKGVKKGDIPAAEGIEKTGWSIDPKSWLWRFNNTLSGGGPTVFDDGYHKFSVATYLLGDVEKVVSWICETQIIPGVMNDCPAVIMWKYRDKKLYGVWDIMSSDEMYVQSKYYTCDERVEITGSRGVIWVTRCTATMQPEVAPVILYRDGKTTEFWDMKCDWADSFEASTRDFVEAVKNNRAPDLTGEQGREILKFALAAVDSSAKGSEIYLDSYEDKPVPKKRGLLGSLFGKGN
ncbi:MAG: Gfo/Idh/MocA family oxidoreductase [Oscillospiraceae bacterium]|nr:Gfo/Idh/MocA family oxidoreductase [Oscillospiraceae bacterium]